MRGKVQSRSHAASAHATGGGLFSSSTIGNGLLLLSVNLDGGGDGGLLGLVGGGNDVTGDTEGLGEESDTLVGDGVVKPLPVEDLGEVSLGNEGLDDHHNLEVGDTLDVLVTGEVGILADDDDTFFKKVGEDCSLFSSRHEDHGLFLRVMIYIQ